MILLGNNEDTFLGHKFMREKEDDFESDKSSFSDESDGGTEQAVAPDVTDEPVVALVVDEPAVAYVVNELAVALVADEPDRDQEPPKKQKFRNLDAVLDESNYKHLPSQRKRTFKYSDAKKTMQIN